MALTRPTRPRIAGSASFSAKPAPRILNLRVSHQHFRQFTSGRTQPLFPALYGKKKWIFAAFAAATVGTQYWYRDFLKDLSFRYQVAKLCLGLESDVSTCGHQNGTYPVQTAKESKSRQTRERSMEFYDRLVSFIPKTGRCRVTDVQPLTPSIHAHKDPVSDRPKISWTFQYAFGIFLADGKGGEEIFAIFQCFEEGSNEGYRRPWEDVVKHAVKTLSRSYEHSLTDHAPPPYFVVVRGSEAVVLEAKRKGYATCDLGVWQVPPQVENFSLETKTKSNTLESLLSPARHIVRHSTTTEDEETL